MYDLLVDTRRQRIKSVSLFNLDFDLYFFAVLLNFISDALSLLLRVFLKEFILFTLG